MKGQRYVHKSKWKIIWVIDDDGSRKPFLLDEKGSLALMYFPKNENRNLRKEIQKIYPKKTLIQLDQFDFMILEIKIKVEILAY